MKYDLTRNGKFILKKKIIICVFAEPEEKRSATLLPEKNDR